MNIAIIPARGGSKRIPRKNVRPFRGRPIIAWSIEAAKASGLFDEVMVSTDDDQIAAVAQAAGAVVPFRRSARTADDHATIADVLVEIFDRYADGQRTFAAGCMILPTAPFVVAEDLKTGFERLAAPGIDVVLPVARYDATIWRSLRRDEDGRIVLNFPEHRETRSQDLPPAYHDAGQWCWFDVAAFRTSRVLLGERTGSVILPSERVQDIDTDEDWAMAEHKHARLFA